MKKIWATTIIGALCSSCPSLSFLEINLITEALLRYCPFHAFLAFSDLVRGYLVSKFNFPVWLLGQLGFSDGNFTCCSYNNGSSTASTASQFSEDTLLYQWMVNSNQVGEPRIFRALHKKPGILRRSRGNSACQNPELLERRAPLEYLYVVTLLSPVPCSEPWQTERISRSGTIPCTAKHDLAQTSDPNI